MVTAIRGLLCDVQLFFSKKEEYKIYELGRETFISKKEAGNHGTLCHASMTPELISRWKNYLVTPPNVGLP